MSWAKRRFTRLSNKRFARRVERLEDRLTPAGPLVSWVMSGTAGTVAKGTIYSDDNRNGIRDGGEDGLQGWTVYLDLDESGTRNTDAIGDLEPAAVTNKDGEYTFDKLQPYTYRLTEIVASGWTPPTPASQDVVVVNNKESKADFLNFAGGTIQGTVWNDLNSDGVRQTGEGGLAGWTVFLDMNNNQAIDSGEAVTVTDADGLYAFYEVPPSDYEVTEVLPSGWEVSKGFDIHQTATSKPLSVATQDFANFSLTNGGISGTVWNDVNADGVRQGSEPGLEGWTIFLDLNLDGVLDPGEPSTATDNKGRYSFVSLSAGDYEVTEQLPAGWDVAPTFDSKQTVTVNAGATTTAGDFANFSVLNGSVRGTVWNDLNRNGLRDTALSGAFIDPGLAGWSIFLDLNRNKVFDTGEPTATTDAVGGYSFSGLQVGDYEVHEVVPSGWEVAPLHSDNNTVTVFSGMESVAPDFANFNLSTITAGSVAGTVWIDVNGNGVRDAGDGGLGGRIVFVDLNGNGVLDTGESSATSAADGSYKIAGVTPGTVSVVAQSTAGWKYTAPLSGLRTIALKNAENATGLDFGAFALQDAAIHGLVYFDKNQDGVRQATERGLEGLTVYLDLNDNGSLDVGEPQTKTSVNLYYTPSVDEAGAYGFTHLKAGTYTVRFVLPATLSATPAMQLSRTVLVNVGQDYTGVDCAAVFRANEIRGILFDDLNGNGVQDLGEPGRASKTVFIDLDRDESMDPGEPTTVTDSNGRYEFTGMAPGAYVVRELLDSGREHTYPNTKGGTLWPAGTSNPAVGNVSPSSITTVLAAGQNYANSVSLTLPNGGQLTNLVDVFLCFDDTGSFVNNSPIVRAAFPTIISQLTAALPGIDLGFGVGRFEEYANFASEYATGRPFVLNQPIVAASTPGYMTAIQSALNRTTPGYGGDQPETDIEALYQLVTGLGFDGNNNGSMLDSGAAGLVSTQLNPGGSGDVPSFASFVADSANGVLPAAGNVGGGGFRTGALPIILLATDTGFAYQPRGESTISGVGGLTLPLSALTQTSRPTTPFGAGAGIQQTVTGLNALGALVIGLGTNAQNNLDPRQGLESLAQLTGAINRTTGNIANGTPTPIAPGQPLYFQIASGFGASVANGVVSAIQNAVTSVAVDITVRASDPRVNLVNHSGTRVNVVSGQTASFDIEFVGDGVPHRFDLQFVRNGTDVVLGSIPVVIGTPIPGDGYEFEDLEDGEFDDHCDFGSRPAATPPAQITGVTINGGNAQRSSVTSVAVAFNQHVTLPALAESAFQLTRHSDGAMVNLAASVDDTGPGTVVNLTFTGGAVQGVSLTDGRFDLTVFAALVANANGQLDGDGNGAGGDNYTLTGDPATNKLYRLFGDVSGDGFTDNVDFVQYRFAHGSDSTMIDYNAAFDVNGDGFIDNVDFIAFRGRLGMPV